MKMAPGAVGVSGDVPRLLQETGLAAIDAKEAIDRGWLWREKIEGAWIYGTSEDAVSAATRAVEAYVVETLTHWLLGPMHPLSGFVAKNIPTARIGKSAVQIVLRRLLREGTLDALGVLTNEYQPYLAAFRLEDGAEVARQIAYMEERIGSLGRIRPSDLPNPVGTRTVGTWRSVMLQHGEYLGLGRMASGVLVAWV